MEVLVICIAFAVTLVLMQQLQISALTSRIERQETYTRWLEQCIDVLFDDDDPDDPDENDEPESSVVNLISKRKAA